MGCASSMTSSSMGSLEKHPSDVTIDPLHLTRINIEKFDGFFAKFETPANTLIGFNNTLAQGILDVKLAAAALLGGFHVVLSPSTDHDIVLLEFTKTDNTVPAADEIDLLLKKADVKGADAKLSSALNQLHASGPSALTASPDGLTGQADFNEALKGFKAAVGAGYNTKIFIRSAAAHGAPTVIATLQVPAFTSDDADKPTYTPATLLQIAATKSAKEIYKAQADVAAQVHALAKATKDISVAFTVKGSHVQPPEGLEDAKATIVTKAVGNFNTQAFKLVHTGCNASHDVNLTSAIVAVIKALRAKAEKLAKDAGKDTTAAVPSFMPKLITNDDGTFDFDLGMTLNDSSIDLPAFPECLPAPAKHVWTTVQGLQGKLTELVEQLAPTKDEVMALIDESKEFFADASDAISAAGLDLSGTLKATASIATNVASMAGVATVPVGFISTAKSVAAELASSVEEIKKLSA